MVHILVSIVFKNSENLFKVCLEKFYLKNKTLVKLLSIYGYAGKLLLKFFLLKLMKNFVTSLAQCYSAQTRETKY